MKKRSQRKRNKNNKFWEEQIAYFPWYDTGHIENDASNNSSIVACLFVTAVTFLEKRCLATIGGFLPSRRLATIGGIHTHAQTARWSHKPTLFFQNKESRLKINKDIEKDIYKSIYTGRESEKEIERKEERYSEVNKSKKKVERRIKT
jgi:hypothetical protein